MPNHSDPLVALWRQRGRPLTWRPWLHLSEAERARLRFLLLEEMHLLDQTPGGSLWAWEHAHREVLELKVAEGRT